MTRFTAYFKSMFLILALFLAGGCASNMGELQRASARGMSPVPQPTQVVISNVNRGMMGIKWTATAPNGDRYDCSSDDMMRRPLCVKIERQGSASVSVPVQQNATVVSSETAAKLGEATKKAIGNFAVGADIGLLGGISPSVQYNVGENLALEGALGLYSGVTTIGAEGYYRFRNSEQKLGESFSVEPIAGAGLHRISIDDLYGGGSVIGYSASGGVYGKLLNYPHWRLKGVLSYLQFDYGSSVVGRGFNTNLGVSYFF